MRNYHVRPQSLRLYLRVLFLSLACLSLDASAFYSSSSAGNVTTLGTGIANAQNSSKFTYGLASPLGVGINTGMGLPLPGGSLAVAVEGIAPMAKVVSALGRFLGTAIPVLAVGVAIYDLARELGFTVSKNPDGSIKVDSVNSAGQFSTTFYGKTYTGNSVSSVCSALNSATWGSDSEFGGTKRVTLSAPAPSGGGCDMTYISTWGPNYGGGISATVTQTATPTQTYSPATQQQLLDAIQANQNWGSASALTRVLADAVKSGEQVEVEPKTITGPATSPGISTVTKDAVANTTTTSTTTNKYDYAGNTVTTTQVTNNITTNNSTGAVTNNTTTTTTPKAEAPTKTQCETNPTSVGCADFGTPTSDNLDKKSHAVQVFATTFTSSSGCPAPLTFNVRSLSYSIPYQPLCDRLATLRALFLVMAGFMAAWILSDSFKV